MTYTAKEPISIRRLNTLSALQAAACSGSAGQGAFLARHCIKADALSSTPDAIKRGPLFADSHMIPGTAAVRPAITAPAPMVISRAGSAQQTSVDVLANKDRVGPMRDLRSIGFIRQAPRYCVGWPQFDSPLSLQAFQFAYPITPRPHR